MDSEFVIPRKGIGIAAEVPPHIVPAVNYLVRCTCECGKTLGLKMSGEGSWLIIAELTIRCDSCGHMFLLDKTNLSTNL